MIRIPDRLREASVPLARTCAHAQSVSFLPLWPRGVTRHGGRCQLMPLLSPAAGHTCHPTGCALLGASRVVGWMLGSHAHRIEDGGACLVTSIPVGMILPSQLGRQFLCVCLKARTETLCPSDRCLSASVTTCEGEQSRNAAYFVSFTLASSSSRNCTTVVLGCFGGAFKIAIKIFSLPYSRSLLLRIWVCLHPCMHGKTRSPFLGDGRE